MGIAQLCGAIAIAVGIAVLVGWVFDVQALKSILPQFVAMKANTALGFVFAGLALNLSINAQAPRGGRIPQVAQAVANILAMTMAVIGLVTLLEYVLGQDFGIDQWLIREPVGAVATSHPGRMAPPTALNFFLLGIGMLGIDLDKGRRLANWLFGAVVLVSLLALYGYVYGATPFYAISRTTGMALHTAIVFLLLAVGGVCAHPKNDLAAMLISQTSSGILLRRLLPVTFLLPLFLGWLRLHGEQMGLYDTAFGVALTSVAFVVMLLGVLVFTLRKLSAVDYERALAQETLRASEERLRTVIETARDAIVSADVQGRIISWNAAAESIFGRLAREALGQSLTLLMPDRFRQAHEQGLGRFITTGEPRVIGRTIELIGLRKDGAEFPIELSLSTGLSQQKRFFTAIIRDITERKRAQVALEEAHKTLQDTQQQLIQAAKLESVGRLAAGAAHEVRNPLAIIQMGLSYLMNHDWNTQGDGKEAHTVLAQMEQGVQRADSIIRGLLDFAAHRELESKPGSINAVIEAALVLVKHEMDKAHVRLQKDLSAEIPAISIDAVKMEQVFINLFMNAIQAMKVQGTLTIRSFLRSATSQEKVLMGQSFNGSSAIAVEIEDTGPGIPEENLPKVFDPFFTNKPPGQGTGLGLAVTRTIVNLHHGIIRLENCSGAGGAKATLLFPC